MNAADYDPTKDSKLLALVAAYCNETLTNAELVELERLLLEAPEARAFFRRYLGLDAALHEYGQSAATNWRATTSTSSSTAAPGVSRQRNYFRFSMIGVAAAMLIGVGALITFTLRGPTPSLVVGSLEQVSGDVRVLASDGTVQTVISNAMLRSGDTVRTRGTQSSTVVAYADGTRLTLVGNTSVTCGDQGSKNLVVHQGTLAASVRPQPQDRPMILTTPSARVQVLGTQFLIEAVENRTDLSVSEGRVRLVRVSDGEAVDVSDGKQAAVTAQNQLVVEDIPRLATTWEEDFEDGLGGWDQGEHVASDLPESSRGGIKAIFEQTENEAHYKLRSNDGWLRGLFAVKPGSHLHVTFKTEDYGWLNVFIVTRTPAPEDASFAANFMFNDFPRITPGKWLTATIPLSEFARQHRGTKELEELVPYRLVFTAEHRGLIVDRVWLTTDGPGKVELKESE